MKVTERERERERERREERRRKSKEKRGGAGTNSYSLLEARNEGGEANSSQVGYSGTHTRTAGARWTNIRYWGPASLSRSFLGTLRMGCEAEMGRKENSRSKALYGWCARAYSLTYPERERTFQGFFEFFFSELVSSREKSTLKTQFSLPAWICCTRKVKSAIVKLPIKQCRIEFLLISTAACKYCANNFLAYSNKHPCWTQRAQVSLELCRLHTHTHTHTALVIQ